MRLIALASGRARRRDRICLRVRTAVRPLGVDTQQLAAAGDTHRSAPLIVGATTLTWASEFCMVGKMYKADRALYIEGRCSNGGALTRHPITLAMKGERMAVTWNGEHTEMRRCP